MKKLILMLLSAATLSFVACDNDKEADNDDANNTDTVAVTHTDTMVVHERNTYRTGLQRDIDSMQNRLDSLNNRAETKTDKGWQKTKSRLQMRIDRAKADLQEFGNKADNEWDDFRTTVDRRMDTLRMEWDSLKTDIKGNKK
jgi:hypothetical protein